MAITTSTLVHGHYPRLFHGNSRIREVFTLPLSGVVPVFCMKLSPNGRFLATGDEDGTLEVRSLQGRAWQLVCVYSTGAAVRTITWHPLEPRTLFCGSANGALSKITIVFGGENVHCDALLPGYIHLLQFSPDGRRLGIAHGTMVSVVDNPFAQRSFLGPLVNLQIPMVHDQASITGHSIPRGIFFPPYDDSIVLVAFFGRQGLRAYSLLNQHSTWSIPLRQDAMIGSVAISPSGERIAAMNLQNGIDFYSTSRRQYISTVQYSLSSQHPPQNFLVDIVFVDEDTVAFGHSDGHVGFATFGIEGVTSFFEINRGHENNAPVQVVTFGLVEDKPLVFGLTSPQRPTTIHPLTIHIGCIETPGAPQLLPGRSNRAHTRNHAERIPALMFLGIFSVTLLSILLGQSISHRSLRHKDCPPASIIARSHFAKETPDHLPPATTTSASPTFDPLSTCICTVTGTFDAAKETGDN